MKPSAIFLCLSILFVHIACAQERAYDHTITLRSDNDNFAGHSKDGYYTNGFFIRLAYIPRHFKLPAHADKLISWYSVGQQIFTSESIFDEFPPMIDRPFSAYLFAQKGYQFFYKTGRSMKLSFSAGLTGKGALGQEVQNTYHDLLKLIHTRGWYYQLNTGLALNAEAEGFSAVGKKQLAHPSIHFSYQLRTGTVYNDLTGGLLMRIGKKQPLSSSCFSDGNLGEKKPARELFFYFWPRLRYQVYNATVQGGLFIQDKGPFTSPVTHGQWIAEGGICISGKQQSFCAAVTGQTREATTMRHDMVFGSITYRHFLHIKHSATAPGTLSVN